MINGTGTSALHLIWALSCTDMWRSEEILIWPQVFMNQPLSLLPPSLSFWMFWVSWCLAAITNKSHHQKEMERSRRPLSSETGQESFPFAKHPTERRMFRTPLFRVGSLCMHGAQRNNDILDVRFSCFRLFTPLSWHMESSQFSRGHRERAVLGCGHWLR